ncbi:MAG TPA: hypothetical protein VHC22_18045 [Pirellulales bacterium]|nr:hypothetical protein [Pirellulales bacterium]
MKTKKLRYRYAEEREGVNDLWVVVDTKTGRDIACAIYWDSEPDWMERTRADIRLIVDALNAYPPARNRRAKP